MGIVWIPNVFEPHFLTDFWPIFGLPTIPDHFPTIPRPSPCIALHRPASLCRSVALQPPSAICTHLSRDLLQK
jgi:hypothetical protein